MIVLDFWINKEDQSVWFRDLTVSVGVEAHGGCYWKRFESMKAFKEQRRAKSVTKEGVVVR